MKRPPDSPTGPPPGAGAGRKRIFVVDDDRLIAKLLETRLRASDYQASIFTDAAVLRERARAERPDLLIMDVRLREGSGFALYRDLLASAGAARLPAIFITAFGREEVAEWDGIAREAGEENVFLLKKPFAAQELLDLIERALGGEAPKG